jgi:hypothetical protein
MSRLLILPLAQFQKQAVSPASDVNGDATSSASALRFKIKWRSLAGTLCNAACRYVVDCRYVDRCATARLPMPLQKVI